MKKKKTFSQADVALMYSAYCDLAGESFAPHKSGQTTPLK